MASLVRKGTILPFRTLIAQHVGRVGNSLIGFSSKSLIFFEPKSDSLVKKSEPLPLLFCHEQPEQIAHGRSFVESKEQQEQFAHGRFFKRVTRANCSECSSKKSDGSSSLFCCVSFTAILYKIAVKDIFYFTNK